MEFEIIDFHIHPYFTSAENICKYDKSDDIDFTPGIMKRHGVSKFCGSVLSHDSVTEENVWECLSTFNDHALKLYEHYGDMYVAGCHVHPKFIKESKEAIDLFYSKGLRLVGEIVPWRYKMNDSYNSDGMLEILDYASSKGMVISAHPTSPDDMDLLCDNLPDAVIVGAHPSENVQFKRHVARAKKHKNYYVDLSGSGIHRYKTTRRLVDEIGADKVIFGSDYPICNLQIYVDGVTRDEILTDDEKRLILAGNAKRILQLD